MNTHFNLYYLFRKDQQAYTMPAKTVRRLQKMIRKLIVHPCNAKNTMLKLNERKRGSYYGKATNN